MSIESPEKLSYEEYDDDVDHNQLVEARQTRKRTEEDAKLLANRIALLKLEEAKAWKKIEETRKKAKEIMETRARNIEQQKKKEEERRQKEEEVKQKAMQNRLMKEQQKQIMNQNKSSIQQKAAVEAQEIKRNRVQNKAAIEAQKQHAIFRNTLIKQDINNKKYQAAERRKKLEMEKKARAKAQLQRRLEEENRIRQQNEEEVSRMEQEELELISRLQNTQMMQRSAYEDLEQALAGQIDMNSFIEQHKMAAGVTTEWEDIHVKLGNFAPRPKEPTNDEIQDAFEEILENHDQLKGKNLDELDELEDEFDDEIMREYRRKRLEEIKQQATRPRFGSLQEISRQDYVREVTEAPEGVFVILLLYQNYNQTSLMIANAFEQLSRKFVHHKFLKIVATRCIENLDDQFCPALLIYKDGTMVHQLFSWNRVVGNQLDANIVEWELAQLKVLETDFEERPKIKKKVQYEKKRRNSDLSDSDDDREYSSTRIVKIRR